MILSEDSQHKLLLVIIALLFVIFSTGAESSGQVPVQPVIVGAG